LVHAAIKPGNVLTFPENGSPFGVRAKITGFGFTGMVTYNNASVRAPLPNGRSRGGTMEWNAPECLYDPDLWTSAYGTGQFQSLNHPQYLSSCDVYSFGLLACYIALNGQTPKLYVTDLTSVKLEGGMVDVATIQIDRYYYGYISEDRASLEQAAVDIARKIPSLGWVDRIESLRSIRKLLFGR